MKKWSPEELKELWKHYEREVEGRRGSNLRYWGEVEVGEELPPLVKGPFTPMSGIAFVQGWGGFYMHGERIAWQEYIERHPGMAPPDELGLPQGPIRVHWDNEFARKVGVPGAYDYGPQRVSWLIHLLTDWIGDDGFVKSLNAQVTRFNIWGDIQFIKGKVLEKLREGIKGIQNSDDYKKWLKASAKLYRYSFSTQFLISLQNENATRVASTGTLLISSCSSG